MLRDKLKSIKRRQGLRLSIPLYQGHTASDLPYLSMSPVACQRVMSVHPEATVRPALTPLGLQTDMFNKKMEQSLRQPPVLRKPSHLVIFSAVPLIQ